MFAWIIILSALLLVTKSDEFNRAFDDEPKRGKAFSMFQVIRFPNSACVGTPALNGTCYLAKECSDKGGVNSGSCANGFGTCCTFTLGCGSTSSENCTYFQSQTTVVSQECGICISKSSSDICQIRLDFIQFVITGPSTVTVTQVKILNGVAISPASIGGVSANYATSCLTDTFSVSGTGRSPPVICGINTGYHMYVDASDCCNKMVFQLGPTGIGTSIVQRNWNIKISQISCFSPWLAPEGCTQYFTGISNIINSYNYAGGYQLANQQQNICMRREEGYCQMCITTSSQSSSDFQISYTVAGGYTTFKCCGYGSDGAQIIGFDCLILPGAVKMSPQFAQIGNGFCGKFLVDSNQGISSTTVCTFLQPFNVQFLTDAYTFATAAKMPSLVSAPATAGFKLIYFQKLC